MLFIRGSGCFVKSMGRGTHLENMMMAEHGPVKNRKKQGYAVFFRINRAFFRSFVQEKWKRKQLRRREKEECRRNSFSSSIKRIAAFGFRSDVRSSRHMEEVRSKRKTILSTKALNRLMGGLFERFKISPIGHVPLQQFFHDDKSICRYETNEIRHFLQYCGI